MYGVVYSDHLLSINLSIPILPIPVGFFLDIMKNIRDFAILKLNQTKLVKCCVGVFDVILRVFLDV